MTLTQLLIGLYMVAAIITFAVCIAFHIREGLVWGLMWPAFWLGFVVAWATGRLDK